MTEPGTQLDPDIRQRVKTVLRRELKLGADAAIPDDMPLIGGDFELDSLDIVLLISAVEKEFGVSIRSENVGKDAFARVDALIVFIQQQASATNNGQVEHNGEAMPDPTPASPANATAATSDGQALLAHLPHQPPFRFLTDIIHVSRGPGSRG